MASPIWKEARRRAKAETLDLLKLDTLPRVLLTIGTPVIAFGATIGVTGQLAIAAVATLVWMAICGLAVYLAKLISIPARIAAEKEAEAHRVASQHRQELACLSAQLATDESRRRAEVVNKLIELYEYRQGGISSEMAAGLELPPQEWLNAELRERGENFQVEVIGHQWRVRERVVAG